MSLLYENLISNSIILVGHSPFIYFILFLHYNNFTYILFTCIFLNLEQF